MGNMVGVATLYSVTKRASRGRGRAVDLSSIKDGELDVNVTSITPELSYVYDSTQRAWEWLLGDSGGESYEKAAKDTMAANLDMTALETELETFLTA